MYLIILVPFLEDSSKLEAEALPQDEVRELNALLARGGVQAELRMTTSQVSSPAVSRRVRQLLTELEQRLPTQSDSEIAELSQRIEVEKLTATLDSLTSQQIVRLLQIHRQFQALTQGPLAAIQREVQLTSAQRALLTRVQSDFEVELREVLWSFHRQSQTELQQVLTAEQRESWNKNVGDVFEFEFKHQGQSLFGILQ